jgi:hypothetical protein
MNRAEVMAIIGQYSRDGYTAHVAKGGVMVDELGYRSMTQARRDTGINRDVIMAIVARRNGRFTAQYNRNTERDGD